MKTTTTITKTFLALILPLFVSSSLAAQMLPTPAPTRPAGQQDMLGFAAKPIPVVRIAFIGLGMRGSSALTRYTNLDGVEIKALCDMEPDNLARAQATLAKAKRPRAAEYLGATDPDAWQKLCQRDDIDLIYICTDWKNHTPMAVYAMQHGKHVAVEVPAATTIDECWQLINTSEKTRRHCMMLENCCYDFFELATLNMAQQGLFGEIMHVEGAYLHDLRTNNFNPRHSLTDTPDASQPDAPRDPAKPTGYYDYWRLKANQQHTGNLYPTHGLGPVCQILNIHRGDRMEFLVSVSTDQVGMTEYARTRFGPDSPEAKTPYAMGDMNTTIIRTAKGKTIMIQHDVTSPRPYSRIHSISGTKGYAQKYPSQQIALEPDAHKPLTKEKTDALLSTYEYPFVKEIKTKAKKVGGHGGMDFIMDYRLIYCLRNGLPLDQDVYDAAEWSCLVELTERSVRAGSAPVEIPDFTRGSWNKLQGYHHAYAP